MSTKAKSRNCSSSNSNSSNQMPAKRGSAPRMMSDPSSSSSLGTTSMTTTSSSVNERHQHVAADKSAVKRKKRRKDDGIKEVVTIVERVPIVLITRLEDERKSNESKSKQTSSKVIERTKDIESIKVSSSNDKLAKPAGKKSSRHSVHRSQENLAGSDAKTLEPIRKEETSLPVIERTKDIESIKASSSNGKSVVPAGKKSSRSSIHRSKENLASSDAITLDSISKEKTSPPVVERTKDIEASSSDKSVVPPGKKSSRSTIHRSKENLAVNDVKTLEPIGKEDNIPPVVERTKDIEASSSSNKSVVPPGKKSSHRSVHRSKENLAVSDAKTLEPIGKEDSSLPVVEKTKDIEASSSSDKSGVPPGKKSSRSTIHRSKENLAVNDAKTLEPIGKEDTSLPVVEKTKDIKASSLNGKSVPAGKKSSRHSIQKSKENLAGSDAKTLDSIRKEETSLLLVEDKVEALPVVEDRVKALPVVEDRVKALTVVEDKVKAMTVVEDKVKALTVVENKVKARPKKSIESTKKSDPTKSRCKKVKSLEKPLDDFVERNVHNVNNDNLKQIDPKITERQLLVRLDRSEVENFLEKKSLQRLHTEDKSSAETSNHSESKIQNDDVLSKVSEEINTCAIPSDTDVANNGKIQDDSVENAPKADVTDRPAEIQLNAEEPVKRGRGRPRKKKNVDQTIENVVNNQRLSSIEEKKAKSQSVACKSNKSVSDKDLIGDTKIHDDSSVQINENQSEHSDESPKDTCCISAKSDQVVSQDSLSSENPNESAVVSSEKDSSEISRTDTFDASSHDSTVLEDSKAESHSAQQTCDINSKSVDEDAKALSVVAKTVDESTEEIIPKSNELIATSLTNNESSESPLENSSINGSTECPATNLEANETSELQSKNLLSNEASEDSVNDKVTTSPTDSFMSCENADPTNEGLTIDKVNESLIEAIEDSESSASTCTLIEETPEELSQEMDKEFDAQDESSNDVDKEPENGKELAEDAYNEIESIKELSKVAEKEISNEMDTSLKCNGLDESSSQDDKIAEANEQESTFENNLKSVENLVIDSILNGEIVSPKMMVQSMANRVEEVQSFVFENSVEDFVNDIEATKDTPPASLESPNPVEETPVLKSIEPLVTVEAPPVAETLAPPVPIEEPVEAASSVPLEEPITEQKLPAVEQLATEESSEYSSAIKETTVEETLESLPCTKETSDLPTQTKQQSVEEEFASHRRKHTLRELRKKCTENIDKRNAQALEKISNDADYEEQQPLLSNSIGEKPLDDSELLVPSSVLSSDDYPAEPTAVSSHNCSENISDTESDICLSDRLSRLSNLKIPSLDEEPVQAEKSEGEESSRDHTKRQRIVMKITKTDSNKHVTHLVDSKEDEEETTTTTSPTIIAEPQLAAEQVTEGEIKIIMRKESNNHVIKEIKIIPRTPEGNNSARIPGYSPTSSDLSSGNSSCRVPSCSPAKPDSGSYRMPGWSPASTEIGQSTTVKKKQGRPKKYPIFTDAELIAKTTAIVKNSEVHANKLTEKALFEPVESIRINEDDEVEMDEEEEQHTHISEQMCLSGSQLLEAMPAQPEVLAKFAKEIEESQQIIEKKKKKMGRPRKYPLTDTVVDDVVTKPKVNENITVARIEFSVVDSIEEFVEPDKQTDEIMPASPVKKIRGRPRKVPMQIEASGLEKSAVEESDSTASQDDGTSQEVNFSMTKDEAIGGDPPVIKSRVENRGRKSWKHSKADKIAEEASSVTEGESADDTLVDKPRVERKSRMKNLNDSTDESQVTEETNPIAENTINEDASVIEPRVERRGRKSWKRANKLSENQVAEVTDSVTEGEATDDVAVVVPYVERRGRKPWKHLKDVNALSKNEVAEETNSNTEEKSSCSDNLNAVSPSKKRQYRKSGRFARRETTLTTENESADDTLDVPYTEKKGRKPREHSKDDAMLLENQVVEDTTTEYETMSDTDQDLSKHMEVVMPGSEKKKRGRPRKYPQNQQKQIDSKAQEYVRGVCALFEKGKIKQRNSINKNGPLNDVVAIKNVVDRLVDVSQAAVLTENFAIQEKTASKTESDSEVPLAELMVRRNQNRRLLKNLQDKIASEQGNSLAFATENSMTEEESADDTLATENEVPVVVKKKMGRPRKYRPEDDSLAFAAENSMTEEESADDTLGTENEVPVVVKKKMGRPRKYRPEDNSLPVKQAVQEKEASLLTEDKTIDDTSAAKKKRARSRKLSQDDSSVPENSTVSQVSSINEDDNVNDTTTAIETLGKRKKRSRKITQDDAASTEINAVVDDKSSTHTEDETVSSTEDIPTSDSFLVKHGRASKIITSPIKTASSKKQDQTSSMIEDETVSSTEDIPAIEPQQNDQPIVKKKMGRPRKVLQIVNTPSAENSTTIMEPPMVVKRRGRPPKNLRLLDSTLLDSNASTCTTEDETVSSTEDMTTSEPPKSPRKNSLAASTEVEMSDSTAASSIDDLSTIEMPAPKKRAKKSREEQNALEESSSSIAASSMEDLSSVEASVVTKKKRSKTPRLLAQDDSTCSESLAASFMEDLSLEAQTPITLTKRARGRLSKNRKNLTDQPETVDTQNFILPDVDADAIEEFSPVKQLSPVKQKRLNKDDNVTPKVLEQVAATLCESSFDNEKQPSHDDSTLSQSAVKRRGRPPKYPRKEIDIPKQVVVEESIQRDIVGVPEPQSPIILEKRKGRIPRRLSQDENILPSITKNDATSARSPRRASHDSGVSSSLPQQNENEDLSIAPPSLGKRQGRPPRKFSPDEEHSFSAVPQPNHVQIESEPIKKQGRPARKLSHDGSLPISQPLTSDSDDKKKKPAEDNDEISPWKRRGRPPKPPYEECPQLVPLTISENAVAKDVAVAKDIAVKQKDEISLPVPSPLVSSNIDEAKKPRPMSTTNLLRQQRKPRLANLQTQVVVAPPPPAPVVAAVVETTVVPQPEALPKIPPPSPVKKRGRSKLHNFDAIVEKKKSDELPDGLTIDQLRRRRHSQDDSMFTENLAQLLTKRSKEFEDVQAKKKRGRPPRMRELSKHFVLTPLKPNVVEKATITPPVSPGKDMVLEERIYRRMGRPRTLSPEKNALTVAAAAPPPPPPPVEEETSSANLTAADFLRSWTDRDESPSSQCNKKTDRQRRYSQDDNFDSRPLSRNRLRRYSQGDATTGNDDGMLTSARKRRRSSGSDSSIVNDEKRPRVEKELCDQHSITKELVVQLTKIDKPEETPVSTPASEPIREILRMTLRRKIESNNNAGPPPLVPFETRPSQSITTAQPSLPIVTAQPSLPIVTAQPSQPITTVQAPPPMPPAALARPTISIPGHQDGKLLMLMQPPTQDKHQAPGEAQIQPPTQQFCIIFIPDALTSSESSLNRDSQPTATIVNFQPVPDSELASKSVIYTPTTTPTKIFVNSEEQQNRSFLCSTCTQALDLVGRLEANVGMTEEDKSAIKCPYCSNDFQSLFYLEYHLRQEHLKCENEKQCRHSGFNTLRIPSLDASSESEIYITFALKCRSCYELFENVLTLNEHVKAKHANLIRHKPAISQFSSGGSSGSMVCYPPPPPFKNGARAEVLHCPSDCICRIGIRSSDSPMQRAQVLKRCPNFMRRMEKIEAAAYEVYTCTLCKSTFLMKDEVVEHLMKMHEVSCKFPCTKCLASFRSVHLQENHHCSETTIRDLDKLLNIVIMSTDKSHDNSKFEDSSNDELGPIKTTPPPAVPSASTPLNGVKRKNGVVIQRLTKFLTMQPPKKPKLDGTGPGKKRQKTPCPKCQKKFAYRKSLNDHITFEHIIPCNADENSKNMAVELLRLVNNGATDVARIEELATALGKYTDDDGVSLRKLTMMDDEQENWNESQIDQSAHNEKDSMQCVKCKTNFKLPANSVNPSRRNNHQSKESPQLCSNCDSTRRRRSTVNNGHGINSKASTNGQAENQTRMRYNYECDQCSDSFSTTIELNRHKSDEHSNRPSDALKCDVCSKIFYSSRMLDKHRKIHHDDSLSSSRTEDDENMECNNQSGIGDVSNNSEANDTTNSSTSRRDSSDNNKEEEKSKCPRCDFSAEKVSLKNHLKREHGIMAFICQFCGKLLVDISEVRHMLDSHIKSSRKNGNVGSERYRDEITELARTLGKKRLQSLMIYHDFEGKCNNAIMRCPICPEQFATRESCRHHYQWMHDSTCILCDAHFSGGNVAGQHKVAVHNSIASYVWAIQRLVSAIVHSMRLDRAHPSQVLYQEVVMRLGLLDDASPMNCEGESTVARSNNGKSGNEENTIPEPFLEPVVLSEDQLPGSGNMIEVVIGNDMVVEESEDNLLEDFYLSPNYESSCEQATIYEAGSLIPELEEEEEIVSSVATVVASPMVSTCTALAAVPTTPSLCTSSGGILIPTNPVTADTYATSAVFKLRQENGQEEVVLAITDEDLVTYRDDVGSLAMKLSATCDSLSLEEITTMLMSYFENVGISQTEEVVEFANAIETRTQ